MTVDLISTARALGVRLLPRAERVVACSRCGRSVGLREDGRKRAHGTDAAPKRCRDGGEWPTAEELR